MTEEEMRLECLRLAVKASGDVPPVDDVIAMSTKFYQFLACDLASPESTNHHKAFFEQ